MGFLFDQSWLLSCLCDHGQLKVYKSLVLNLWHIESQNKMADSSSEHFNLAWNQFESCAASTFKTLLTDQSLADITLVSCDGEKQVTAHKVILSACSPFLKRIILKNPHQHPLLYLKGVKFRDLQLIVKFMYLGQIEIGRDCLPEFLAAAKELEVKGLMEADNPVTNDDEVRDTMEALEPQTEIAESDSDNEQENKLVMVQGPDWEEEEYSGHGSFTDYGNAHHDVFDNN